MPTASRSSSERPGDGRLDALIDRLRVLRPRGAWVVSAYCRLDPRDRQRRRYLIEHKNRARERFEAFAAGDPAREDRVQVRDDLDRVQAYLEASGNLPAGRGVAVFACRPARLFDVVPLARVLRSRVAIDRSPLVRELEALRDEFGRMLCVVTDRASARLFVVTAGGAFEAPGIVAPASAESAKYHGGRQRQTTGARGRAVGASGVGEHNWHQRIRVERHRHYATIADRLFAETRRAAVRGIVLAGTAKDVAGLMPHLHPYVRDLVLGTARLNPQNVEPAEVLEQVLERRRERERAWERRHAAELAEAVATGWGVQGVEATLAALARGQVRTLLVAGDAPEVAEDAIEDALRTGAHVDIVEDAEARARVEGLGALLRFPRA